MKGKLIVLFSVTLLLIGVYWAGTHSYIEVRLQSGVGTNTKVQLLNQADSKSTELTAKGSRVKKLVRRGQYEILVKQGNSSFFAVSKSKGWLGTTSVDAVLVPERDRQFIGDNPGPCGTFNNRVLVTYGCGDTFHNALIHMPATTTQPTYALKSTKSLDGIIEGTANTSEGTIVVLKRLTSIDRDSAAAHTAYLLNEKAELTGGVALKGLDENRTYTVSAYKQGFLMSTDTFGRLFYFTGRDVSPVEIDTKLPNDMEPYAYSASEDSIVVAHAEEVKHVDPDDPKTAEVKSQATVISGQQTSSISLNLRYASLIACGQGKLCTLLNKKMEVYDISKDKPKLMFTVLGVDQMNLVKDRLVIVRGKEILTLNIDKRSGSIDYSLGDYDGCGLLAVSPGGSNGYTVCVINARGKKAALLIDPSKPDQDNIDKKIAEVLKTSEIKNMTIYGNYITFTPEAGKTIYDPTVKEFRYSPEKIRTASAAINQAIDRAGIDRSKYQVRNTLD